MNQIRPGRPDIVLSLALAVLLGLLSYWLLELTNFAIPRRNVYFNADTDRVFANLIDRNSNHLRLNVHPLFGLVCIAFQNIFDRSVGTGTIMAFWTVMHGIVFAQLLYWSVRLWGGRPLLAFSATLLGAASAGFVFWVAITETHLMGGLTVLVIALLHRWKPRLREVDLLKSATMLVCGLSIVLTNAMAWAFAQLRLSALWRGKPLLAFTDNLRAAPKSMVAGLAGLGLLALLSVFQDFILRNPSVPPLLRVWIEEKYVTASRGTVMDLLGVMGIAEGTSLLPFLINLTFAIGSVVALWRLGPKRAFIPLWVLFGLILHSVYDRAHGFLFSPNYMPMAVVAVSLAIGSFLPRYGWIVVLAAALMLAPLNLHGFVRKQQEISPQTDPSDWYDHLRDRHDVPQSNIVREADPPIGFDQ